ncbi:GAP family protein [Leucobacter sp. BZR 635]
MNTAIGDILPFAVAIAISPIPIIATILMLMSPRPRPLSLGFLAGWLLGIAVAVVAFTLLAGVIPEREEGASQPILGVVQLLIGLALLLLAVKQWRSRPKAGETAELPKWMAAIDTMKPVAALALGFALAAVNPKNLLMAVAAGASIGHTALGAGANAVVIIVFVVLAALSVALPVVAYLVAPGRASHALDAIRAWLTENNAAIMAVVLVLLGAQLLGKGIGSF